MKTMRTKITSYAYEQSELNPSATLYIVHNSGTHCYLHVPEFVI